MGRLVHCLIASLAGAAIADVAVAETKMLGDPAVHDGKIAFEYRTQLFLGRIES